MVRPDMFVSSLQSSFWGLIVSCCPWISVSGWVRVICRSTEAFWRPSDSDTGEHPWNQIKSVQYSDNPLHLYTQTSVIMLSPRCFQNGIPFYLILWVWEIFQVSTVIRKVMLFLKLQSWSESLITFSLLLLYLNCCKKWDQQSIQYVQHMPI